MTKPVDPAMNAAKQLEAFFLRQMLTEARPSGGGALDGGFAGDTFKSMLDDAIADKMSAAGGIGLADMMAKQLAKQAGTSTETPAVAHLMMQPPTRMGALGAGAAGVGAVGAAGAIPPPGPVGPQIGDAPQLILPVAGTPTSGFGSRTDPVHGTTGQMHPGFDLAAPTGTPVGAAAGGTITHAGPAGTYGNLVIVKHASGYETRYAHLSKVTVKEGDEVQPGQQIGNVGTTGYSTGPHLHFEVRHDGKPIDPAPMLPLKRSQGRTNR
jgi:murein DD-endopeptidase MepM/ murein hydrolase activator NlpD|nr:peptidoglycan DD-metalloendopeptidase family protein [Kofleriaceae bacterium]